MDDHVRARAFLATLTAAVGVPAAARDRVDFAGTGSLPSVFAVSDFATAAVATAAGALSEFMQARFGVAPRIAVDRRMASLWFGWTFEPLGWKPASLWDAVAGDYATADGWIRLHTNAPHHRDAALAVLGVPAERDAVARAVRTWKSEDLEIAVVQNKGCAAAMHGLAEWAMHPQGRIVPAQPLVRESFTEAGDPLDGIAAAPERPLRGIRVLDLTRVLAGPVATRFLAGFGATVLRLDPPGWDEPGAIPEVALGKRCARLDLHDGAQRAVFESLLRDADVLVHGYRADALERHGLDEPRLRSINPSLVVARLTAYGWSGPWAERRGFDSLVQMSSGIAARGAEATGADRPFPLPAQALDHATGYLLAAGICRALAERVSGSVATVRVSLARTAALLVGLGEGGDLSIGLPAAADLEPWMETVPTAWGPLRRIRHPGSIAGWPFVAPVEPGPLGAHEPSWNPRRR